MRNVIHTCVMAFAFILLWNAPAAALSWRTETRADWRSLDCLQRRLTVAIEEVDEDGVKNLRVALLHVRAMLVRHGGEFAAERAIPIPDPTRVGEDEADLILAQHGYAGAACNIDDLLEQLGDATVGRFKRWLWRVAKISAPWLIIAAYLWHRWRSAWRAYRAMDERVERIVPDKQLRRVEFADPDIAREHARVRARTTRD